MSQLPEQLLKPGNIPIMMPMTHNMGIINQVGMPQSIQAPQNIPQNPNLPMGITVPEQKPSQNPDTSNYFIFLLLF